MNASATLWQVLAVLAAIVFPFLGILNVYLLNQVRLGVTDMKLQMLEARAKDMKELRDWVESEFHRKEAGRFADESLATRLASLEARRRLTDRMPG